MGEAVAGRPGRSSRRYRARHLKRKGGRSRSRKVLLGVNVVVATALVLSASAFAYAEWRLHEIHRVHVRALTPVGHDRQSTNLATGKAASAAPPETILLVGSDSRAALSGTASAGEYGSAEEVGGARSDTIILVRLVPATKQIEMLSIPRDLYVPIAGLGDQKINAALGVSPDLLISTIQSQLGVDVNHYVDIDFQSFKDISTAIGGVDVYFPTPARDEESNLDVPSAGCVSLVGNQALAFVRSRMYQYYLDGYWHQEGQSDLARIQRQQLFIRKMVGKAERTGLTDPVALNGIIGGVTKNLTVDDKFSLSDMLSLVQTFRSVDPSSILGLTLPTYAETLPGPDDVLMPLRVEDQAMVQQFLALGEGATPAPAATTPPAGATTTTTSGLTSPSPAATPTTAALAPSDIAVQVDNGSGVTGQAGAASTALRQAGYDVVGTGTAPSYDYATSVIEYGAGGGAAAAQLQAIIGGGATLQESTGTGRTLELITGQSYTGLLSAATGSAGTGSAGTGSAGTGSAGTGSAGTGSATSSTVPTTVPPTTVPATTTTTYALPGTPATGALSCD